MKRNTYKLGAILVVMVLLLAGIIPASAAEKTQFTCIEEWGGLIDDGVWTTYPNGNIHVRGMTFFLYETVSDPRISGTNYVTQNANWGPDYTGPHWGTFKIVNEHGWWEGTWNGIGGDGYHAIGKGFGDYAGLHFRWLNTEEEGCSGEIF